MTKEKRKKEKDERLENEDRERNDKVATRSRHFYADVQHRRTVGRSNKLFSKVSTTSFGVAEGPTGTPRNGERGRVTSSKNTRGNRRNLVPPRKTFPRDWII